MMFAPWTDEQVHALCARQQFGHPYTCKAHSGTSLEPTRWGWVCPLAGCGYRQGWAHVADLQQPKGPVAYCDLCSAEHAMVAS